MTANLFPKPLTQSNPTLNRNALDRTSRSTLKARLPPLENGDRLPRPEFERRYAAMPDCQKAELIEGVVYLASPLRFESHAQPHGWLITWMGIYQISTPGVMLGIEPTIQLDLDNEPQPDGVLMLEERVGGQAHLIEEDYIEGAPELVVEIAASSAAKDLHIKKQAYRRNGIQEYIVWQSLENQLHWWQLQAGEYVSLDADEAGILRSQVFPGLWLDVPALLQGNLTQVMENLQKGLNAPEHNAFVARLSK